MKAISLIKLFTLVAFLVVGLNIPAYAVTQEACKAACSKKAKAACTAETGDKYNGCVSKQQDSCESADSCENLDSKADSKERDTACKQSLKDYDDAMKKTDEECGRLDVKSNKECRDKAKSCSKGLNAFGDDSEDSETAAGSIVKLIGVYGQMQNASSASGVSSANGCVIENNEAADKEEERIDDKITKIREDIQDLKEKATEADKKLNEKRQEVEKDMLDVEKDADKAKFDKQTKNQEEAGRMQKAIMASEIKRKLNLNKIADIQVEIANFSFAHQQLNLSLADSTITKKCRDVSNAAVAAKLKGTINPATGKEVKPKFSQQESAQFKKDLNIEETNCLQQAALTKQAKTKELIDAKRAKNVQIEALNSSNVDEAKSIENELKQMEALKAISTEEEAKSIDAKIKKLDTLNKSVTDMEKHVADKKKTFNEKSKAKEDQIGKLLQDRQKVKAKFTKVSSTVSTSGRAASVYLNQCCTDKDTTKNHQDCGRVSGDEPDAKTAKTKSTPAVKK